ncbi:hypothetical protein BDV98DRAFT_606541, partial [Pterulicium gracile]
MSPASTTASLPSADSTTKSNKTRSSKPVKLPTYVGYDIPHTAFIDLAFSFPSNRDLDSGQRRTYLHAQGLFPKSRGFPSYMGLLHPDHNTDSPPSRRKFEDYMVYFFPVRRIRAIESYHSELYTLEPTEQDQKALARFKSWVEKLGGEFEPAQATFRAVPPIYLGESHFSYYFLRS